MKRVIILALALFGKVSSYGSPPPPPPPCNTPQCSSGTYCFSNTNVCTTCPAGYMYNANPNVGVSSANLWGCSICPPGTFSSSSGSASCSPCPIGTFTSSSGSTACTACPSGSFNTARGQSGCSACVTCALGQYISSVCTSQSNTVCLGCSAIANCAQTPSCSSASNSQCAGCIAGYYLQSNSCVACTVCSSGLQYETVACSSSGNRQCTTCTNTCPVGSALVGACSGTSNPTCQTCSVGSYKALADGSPCLACTTTCLAGFQLNPICASNINSVCLPCPSGSYKALSDGSACLPCTASCVAGYQLNQPCSASVNPLCVVCLTGSYKALTDGSACLPCTASCLAGYQLSQPCSAVVNPICTICPDGSYKALLDGSACLPCTASCVAGYQLSQACSPAVNPQCLVCPSGFYKTLADGSPCLPCNNNCGPGAYLNSLCSNINNPVCLLCPVNTANPNAFSVFSSACIACPSGSIAAAGSATCLQCPLGAATFGLANCTLCLPGSYADSVGSITCKFCPVGSANANTGSTNLTECLTCAPGYTSLSGSASCSPCPLGTYENGLRTCSACPVGTYNGLLGQTVCPLCPAGSFNINTNSINLNQCLACSAGSFSLSGAFMCSLCPAGSYTNTSGSPQCTFAPPGTFIPGNGSTVVQTCPPGYYSDSAGAINCTECLPGSYNPLFSSANASACLPCPLGTFMDKSGASICLNTFIGFYQDTLGQLQQQSCLPGTFNALVGSVSAEACLACVPGKYQSLTGSSQCLDCPVGTYQHLSGQVSCLACPAGTYNSVVGAATRQFCLACPVGTYSPVSGANSSQTCLSSPLGAFTNSSGANNYTLCAPGFYQDTIKQTNCTQCVAGTFNPLFAATNSSFCLSAPPGFFVSLPGTPNASACPPGTWISGSGATSCLACEKGTFTSLFGSTHCLPCPMGTFALGSGFSQCEPLGNFHLSVNNLTTTGMEVMLTTNFTATLELSYTCSHTCTFSVNKQIIYVANNTLTPMLLQLTIQLGIDEISVEYSRLFKANLPFTCTPLATGLTRCFITPVNTVITSLVLRVDRHPVNPYSDPAINFSSQLSLINPLKQTYSFLLDNLEAAVKYTFNLVASIVNETYPSVPFTFNSVETLPGPPTGPVQNLVKYFLGLNVLDQANLEQANLQVHWDPPLTVQQHGPIVGYFVEYKQEARTFITYGPLVTTNITPANTFSLFTNETTLILRHLLPDTVYNISVYPLTRFPQAGPGASIVLQTQVSAPPKPPNLTLVNRAETNITVSWSSLTNETGLITKVWIVAEPYNVVEKTAQVVVIPLFNADLPPLPFPHEGVRGRFQEYNLSNPCQDEIIGYTFRSRTTKEVCGGICDTRCEFGTPMLDPTTILPTNDQHLKNDNFMMEFNTSEGNLSLRLVPYLTMKKRFVLNSTDGGLLGFGKIVLGDGKINPNSLLNNTIILPHIAYRIRFIVFTSEVLYSISDPLDIPPFPYPDSVNASTAAVIGIGIALCVVIIVACLLTHLKMWLKRRHERKLVEKKKYLEKEIINYVNMDDNVDTYLDVSDENYVPPLPSKNKALNNPAYWADKAIYKANKGEYIDLYKEAPKYATQYDTVDNPNAYIMPVKYVGTDNNSNNNKYMGTDKYMDVSINVPLRETPGRQYIEDKYIEDKYFDVSLKTNSHAYDLDTLDEDIFAVPSAFYYRQ